MSTFLLNLRSHLCGCIAATLIACPSLCLAVIATSLQNQLADEHRYQEFLAAHSMIETEIRVQKINYALSRESVVHCGQNVKKSIGALVYDLKQPHAWGEHLSVPPSIIERAGLFVVAVYENSPAAAAGLRAGDIIENERFHLVDQLFDREASLGSPTTQQTSLQFLTVRNAANEVSNKSVWATDICAHFVRAVPSRIHDVIPVNNGVVMTKGFVNHSTDEQIRVAITLQLYHAIYSPQTGTRFAMTAATVWDRLFSSKSLLDEFHPSIASAAIRRAGDEFAVRLLGNDTVAKQKTTAFLRTIATEYPAYLQETALNREISLERLLALQG